jgi:hypothetical protein
VLDEAPGDVDRALSQLDLVRGVERMEDEEGFPAYRVLGQPKANADLCPAIYALARDRDWPLRELRRDVRTLETVFNELATTAEVSA